MCVLLSPDRWVPGSCGSCTLVAGTLPPATCLETGALENGPDSYTPDPDWVHFHISQVRHLLIWHAECVSVVYDSVQGLQLGTIRKKEFIIILAIIAMETMEYIREKI